MDERTLLRISLAISLLGIMCLFIILSLFTIKDSSISEFKNEKEGGAVKIKGFVESVQNKEGVAIINLAELRSVSAVFFTSENISFEKNQEVEITGKIRKYKGENELIIDTLRKLRD